MRIHIGHHFFGAGNMGDDLMLAGFLSAVRNSGRRFTLTCCTPFAPASQRRRFPEIEWLPYESGMRRLCIDRCDLWLGLGDTPFQTDSGNWFLEHLEVELASCRQRGKPMYFLGVGINDEEALRRPLTKELVSYASRTWARDSFSAEGLEALAPAGRVAAGADLAHLFLSERARPPAPRANAGFVFNFEDPSRFSPASVDALVERFGAAGELRWIAQETRLLPGSERELLSLLAVSTRERLSIAFPDYETAGMDELLSAFDGLSALVTSRYHAAVIGAWAGSAVTIVARNWKLKGLSRQLGTPSVDDFGDVKGLAKALDECRPIRPEHLNGLSDKARAMCGEFFEAGA